MLCFISACLIDPFFNFSGSKGFFVSMVLCLLRKWRFAFFGRCPRENTTTQLQYLLVFVDRTDDDPRVDSVCRSA